MIRAVGFCLVLVSSTLYAQATLPDTDINTESTSPATSAHQRYDKQPGVAGKIISVGSNTMATLMTAWSQQFKQLYPHVKFQLQMAGSSTAPPALIEGSATIGSMSRALKQTERYAFVRKHGYQPTVIKVATDAIAVFIRQRGDIDALSLPQLDAIFSATRLCGYPEPIERRSQLVNYTGEFNTIHRYGRNSASGTYGLFKSLALCGGDFRADVNELPSSSSVVRTVESVDGAIGYAAYGSLTSSVKALAIGDTLETAVPLNQATVNSGEYPFVRTLFIIVNKAPNKPLDTLTQEFLLFILSEQGQQAVVEQGYFAIDPSVAKRQARIVAE